MYVNTSGLGAVAPLQAPAGFRFIPVPMPVRRRTPGGPALFVVPAGRGLRRGMGDTVGCSPYDIAGQLNIIAQSAMAGLGAAIEQGNAQTPDAFAQNLQSQAVSLCSKTSFGCTVDRCAVPTDLIGSLAAQYAAAYNSTLSQKAQQVAAGDICVPSLASFPGIVLSDRAKLCGYGGAPPPVLYTPGGSSGGSQSNPPAAAGGQAPSARVGNLSRSGQSFQVGDTYQVIVTGPANSQVTVSGTQNGKSLGTTSMGSTDAGGNFRLSGTLDGSTVGTWSETWSVGGQTAGSVNFTVAAAPSSGAGQGSNAGAGAGTSSNTGGGSSTSPPPPPPATGGVSLSDFFSSSLGIGGYQFPVWLLGVVAVGGVYMLTRSSGRGARG